MPSLLIGSSVVKDIDQQKLKGTHVESHSGATVKIIKEKLEKNKKKYSAVTLLCGVYDADKSDANVELIVDHYRELIHEAKKHTNIVNTSSVLPRFRHDLQGKIDSVNAGLQVLCQEEGATFVNTDPSFRPMDNTINDGYYVPDHKNKNARIYLSRAGTNCLAKNLGLLCRNDECGLRSHATCRQCRQQGHKQKFCWEFNTQ
jgi:hypothetical protein